MTLINHKQMLGYSLLIWFFLLLPFFLTVPKSSVYHSIWNYNVPGAHLYQETFVDKKPVDILFIGASTLWDGIRPNIISAALKKNFQHEPVVFSFGFLWQNIDQTYLLLRNIVEKRKIKMVVISTAFPDIVLNESHIKIFKFISWKRDASMYQGLPFSTMLNIYAETVLGAPRQLWSQMQSNMSEQKFKTTIDNDIYHQTSGYRSHKKTVYNRNNPYRDIMVTPPSIDKSNMIYTTKSKKIFTFSGKPLTQYELHFYKKITKLLKEHDIHQVFLRIPAYKERNNKSILLRVNWPVSVNNQSADIVSVIPQSLFHGLTLDMIQQLYYDQDHFNDNGSLMFTKTIAPAIVKIYQKVHNKSDE